MDDVSPAYNLIDTHSAFATLNGMSKGESAGQELVISALKPSISEIAAEAAEMIVDSQLEDGLLKEIPIVGWLLKSCQAINNIRDRLFLKKILLFLKTAGQTSEFERAEFEENCEDPAFRKRVGETLLLHLDKHNSFEKSQILGRVFARYVSGKISYGEFLSLSEAIENIPHDYLEHFWIHWNWNLIYVNEPQGLLYALSGLIVINYTSGDSVLQPDCRVYVRPTYQKTSLGEHMAAIMKESMSPERYALLSKQITLS